jgi:hypothetical protein
MHPRSTHISSTLSGVRARRDLRRAKLDPPALALPFSSRHTGHEEAVEQVAAPERMDGGAPAGRYFTDGANLYRLGGVVGPVA